MPEMAENSPPDTVVGTLIWRTTGGVICGATPRVTRMRRCRRRSHVVRQAQLHGLGAVGDRAAADGDDEVGAGLARHRRRRDHRLARRVRGHVVEQRRRSARRAPARSLRSRRSRGSACPTPSGRRAGRRAGPSAADCLRRRDAEHDLVHIAENDTASMHAPVLPDNSSCFCKDSLAEPTSLVMCEDAGALSAPFPRLRGEGWGEGGSPRGSRQFDSRRVPLTRRERGEAKERSLSLSTRHPARASSEPCAHFGLEEFMIETHLVAPAGTGVPCIFRGFDARTWDEWTGRKRAVC